MVTSGGSTSKEGKHELFKSKDIEVTKITAKNEEYDILTDKYEVVVTAAGGLSRRFLLEEKQARLIKLLKAKNNDLSMRMMAITREMERKEFTSRKIRAWMVSKGFNDVPEEIK
jgi:hypothetical protein